MTIPLNSSAQTLATSTPAKVTTVTSHVAPWFSQLAYPLGRRIILPFYFGEISVTGREHLPTEGPVILAPTHRSRWDSFMVPYAAGRDITGRDLRFMVSANEMTGLQGWFVRRFGGFPVDTEHPGIGSLRHGVELLQNGESLVLFPEGNIFFDNQIHPLKPGLARIALQAEASKSGLGIKIVPISIKYSKSIPHRGCDIKISIGSPLNVADYRTETVKKGAQRLTADLETALRMLHES
ncbi:lysophospholipid acyltransferase family protein [Argonema antarcticum]|uniref:lysophospholipid acyltransferase family protein n=1 Tax=Argonema antarcticum TaxID=2942763 RepID=UPI0020115F4A|nr:lysophospholipid acyltransferase family protein [Argonema antarcticum]MCL1473505.1 1-acyl-sn-glycerol-3-phosphate acyltransferase [Argonema antarcticum A004/B2]